MEKLLRPLQALVCLIAISGLFISNTVYGQVIAQNENFNGGALPAGWAVTNVGGNDWLFGTNGGNNINASAFAYFDDDALGGGAPAETATLTGPVVDMSGYVSANLTFDYNFRALGASALTVEVWDGAAWQNVLTVTADDCGAWGCTYPSANIDVTNYLNAAFQVRYTYDDGGGAWAWYAGVDNHIISGLPQIVMSEDFNGGSLPAGWAVGNVGGNDWLFGTNGGSNIDGSSFAYFDDDALGGGAPAETAMLTSPAFDVTAYTSLQIDYDYNFRALGASALTVEVWDGAAWQIVQTVNTDDCGAWGCTYPNSSIIVSAHINAAFQIRFTYDDGGGAWAWYAGVDNVIIQAGPSCADPTDLAAGGLTTTTADLSWTDNAGASLWDIEFGPAGFTPTGNPTDTGVATNPYTYMGLSANTSYDYYVRADCGSAQSAWVGPFNFTTPCVPLTTFPHTEDFNAGTLPACWSVSNSLGGVDWQFGTDAGQSLNGDNMAFFDDDAAGGGQDNNATLMSPPFDATGVPTLFLDFDYNFQTPGSFTVDVWDGSAWQNVLNVTANDCGGWGCAGVGAYPHQTIDVLAHANANFQVRFVFDDGVGANWGWYAAIDNFVLSAPACPDPNTLIAGSITTTSAGLTWTEAGTATSWILEYGPAGFTPGTGTLVAATTNPWTIMGLTHSTAYDVYVAADCGTDTSGFAGPLSFTTAFGPVTSYPHCETFDAIALCNPAAACPADQDCAPSLTAIGWTQATGDDTDIKVQAGNTGSGFIGGGANGSAQYLFGEGTACNNTTSQTITRNYDVTGLTNPQLQFYRWMEDADGTAGQGFITVDYENPAGSGNWVNAGLYTAFTTGWEEELESLGPIGDTIRFRFIVTTHTGGFDDIGIDEVCVRETPLCADPTSLSASNIQTTQADLNWMENGSATLWDIELGLAGFTPTGNPTDTGVTANPYTYTGLTAFTAYEYYVRADCGVDGTSMWVGPFAFTTPCTAPTAVTLPFNEDFEAGSGTFFNDGDFLCAADKRWSFETSIQGEGRLRLNAGAGFYNGGAAAMTMDRDPSGADVTNYGILTLDMSSYTTSTDLELAFSWMDHGEEPSANDRVWIRGSDSDAWIQVYDFNANDVGNGIYTDVFGIDVDATLAGAAPAQTVSSTFQVRFGQQDNFPATSTTASDGITIDDVEIAEITCPDPTALNATNILTTQADLGWTENGTAALWDIELDTSGFTPTGNPTDTGVTSNPYTYTGLMANTAYDFYVRADCGASQSAWVGPFTFNTACNPIATIPYIETFNGGTGIPACWSVQTALGVANWQVGTDGGQSLNGDDMAFFDDDAAGFGQDNNSSLYSPIFDMTAESVGVLDFDYNFRLPGSLTVEVFDGTSWVNIMTVSADDCGAWGCAGVGAYPHASLSLTPYLNANMQVRFTFDDGPGAGWGWYAAIDNFLIQAPACPDPSNLAANNIGQTQADLSWMENGTATLWNVELGLAGFTPTGNPTDTGVTNPYTVMGLTAATDYEYYVQSDCGVGGTSAWVGPFAFSTLFTPVTTYPWCENFDGLAACEPGGVCAADQTCAGPVAAIGWTQISGDDSDWEIDDGFTSSFQIGDDVTGGGMYFYNESSVPCNNSTVQLLSREYDLTGLADPGIAVEFYTHLDNGSGGSFMLEIEVPSQSGNWSTIYSETAAATGNGWTQQSVVQANTGNTVRFRISSTTGASGFDDIGFDEFCVSGVPCLPAAATSVLATSPAADCAAGFYVDVDITSLGSSTQLSIQDDTGTVMSGITMTGMHQFGPYSSSASVNITIVHDSSQCDLVLPAVDAYGLGCGDSICTAFTIACGETVNGSTSTMNMVAVPGFSLASQEPNCGGGGLRSPNAFYKFVGNGDDVTFSLCPSLFDTRIDVLCHTGGDCSTGTFVCAAGNDDACGTNGWRSEITVNTAIGVDYYVMVHAFGTGVSGNYTLSATCATACTPPANDDCDNSGAACRTLGTAETLNIAANGACSFTTGDYSCAATETFNPTCDPFGEIKGVWYHFNTGSLDAVEMQTALGTATEMNIAIYDACGGTQLTCNNGLIGTNQLSGLTTNTDYYILVWGNTGESGTFDICLQELPPPPANDSCVDATLVNFNDDYTGYAPRSTTFNCSPIFGTNNGAGVDPSEPASSCNGGAAPQPSIWYKMDIPSCGPFDMTISVDNAATNFDATLTLYSTTSTTCDYAQFTEIGCNDFGFGGCAPGASLAPATLTFPALIPGDTYYLKVSNYNPLFATGASIGDFELTATIDPDPLSLALNPLSMESMVDISWSTTLGANHFDLFYGPQGSTGFNVVWDVTSLPPYTVSNLQSGTTYEFWANSNCDGTVDDSYYTPLATITTDAASCTTPDPLQCLTTTANSIDFQWTNVSAATHYHVFYRRVGQAGFNVAWNVSGTSYSLTNLLPSTNYEIWVYAVCPGPIARKSLSLFCSTTSSVNSPQKPEQPMDDPLYTFTHNGIGFVDYDMYHAGDFAQYSGLTESVFEIGENGEMIEFDTDGNAVNHDGNIVRDAFDFGLYPNPIDGHSAVNVEFFLKDASDVTIEVYDLQGNLVEAFDMGEQQYQVKQSIDTERLASGIYNVTVRTENQHLTKKLAVLN